MKTILSLIISAALVVSGYSQTRNVLVGTNNTVVQPTNFWSADASNARTGLGLGTAATNPASAFQPSSTVLSNLASSNGGNLTNITISNVTGLLATNGNGAGLTNLTAANVTGTLAIASGGTAATNASGARTNLGLGWSALTNTNAATSLLGYNTTNFSIVYNGGQSLVWTSSVGIIFSNEVNFRDAQSNVVSVSGTGIVFGSTNTNPIATVFGFEDAGGDVLRNIARTNLGLGATWLTNTNVTNFRTAIGLGATWLTNTNVTNFRTAIGLGATWLTNTNVTNFRTDIGLGWSALTNTNTSGFNTSLYGSGTNPVLVSTSGVVVSPTNFWQVAPLVTTFIESQPTTNQTTNIAAGRNLHIHSLAISTVGITNTIALPTTNSFDGDIALVVHQGPTSSVTAIKTAGAATNLITLNRFEEAVEFVYYNNVWQFNHNPSFTEPIYFSGTNGVGHAAESRTNLGIPLAALTNSNTTNFQAAVFQTNTAPVSGGTFGAHAAWMEVNVITNGSNVSFRIPLYK